MQSGADHLVDRVRLIGRDDPERVVAARTHLEHRAPLAQLGDQRRVFEDADAVTDALRAELGDRRADALRSRSLTRMRDDVHPGIACLAIGLREELRRELRFEPAQTDAEDQSAFVSLDRHLPDGELRVGRFARDVGDEADRRPGPGAADPNPFLDCVEQLVGSEIAQVQRRADEAFGVANPLRGLALVQPLDHLDDVFGLAHRLRGRDVHVDEVLEALEPEVVLPVLERDRRE